ncbi:MAG: NAD-dependent epimerase/dehydratase family protein, partial [Candidatus Omnitrophica bacterium]|nr:NAD-dependent epimerase/dehydratase family protein [Candidatus Omnitrophota bacterium]
FHLAGKTCHILSLTNPFPDIDINIKGTVMLLEACKKNNHGVKLIYTGTRGQYGPSVNLPVNEEAPTNPKGIYEISNLSAEKIILVYNNIHGIKAVLLRLTNIYGPRAQMKHDRYGVVNWFIRQAIDNQTIKVFGDGRILRDFLFVDDCVEAILMSSVSDSAIGEIFNVGIDKGTNFLELTKAIIEVAKTGRWEFAPFSPERAAQEPGDFYSDISKIRRLIGWQPETSLVEGLTKTVEYYRKHRSNYW